MAELAFGRYRVLGELGRGAMAIVYLAEDTVLQRNVAVKALTQQYAADITFRERFQREGRILARAQHESIVPIYDFGESNGVPFIVMKLMAGGTLAERLTHGPMAPERAIAVLGRVASALDAAHAAGVIHRDLKPANVLFDERENAYVADFGVGRLDGASSGMTQPGTVIGTAQYMSPEQVRGGQPSNASDIYSFGALAYETLAGKAPFEGGDAWVVMRKHLDEPPPRPSAQRPWLAFADAAILAALDKDPQARPATATAVVESLRSGSEPAPGYQRVQTTRVTEPGSPSPSPIATTPSAPARAVTNPSPPIYPTPAPVAQPPSNPGGAAPPRAMPTPVPAGGFPPSMPGATRAKRPFWRHPLVLAIGGGAITAALVSVVLMAAFDNSGGNQADPDDTPVATSTPTDEPETPEPTPTPTVPGPDTVFASETFDSPESATSHAFQDETGAGIVANGELQLIDTADDGSLVWTQWHLLQPQVSFQLRGFADVRVLTMACDDDANQIRASVSSRTSSYKVVIFNIEASEFTTLIDWTVSPAILQDQKSTLQLLCQQTAMSFIINGETVASFEMPNVRADTVWVAADGGVDASVFIDDVLITRP